MVYPKKDFAFGIIPLSTLLKWDEIIKSALLDNVVQAVDYFVS